MLGMLWVVVSQPFCVAIHPLILHRVTKFHYFHIF